MFENLLFQDRFVQQIKPRIQAKDLPSSLMIHGPVKSGKLTAALELARSLACEKQGAWSCDCPSCNLHRTMDYPYMILTGSKGLLWEVLAMAQLLEKYPTEDPRRFAFLRAVKKISRRFDPVLWEGEEAKLKGVQGALGTLAEELNGYYQASTLPTGDGLKTSLKKILEACTALAGVLPASGIPIHVIRRISYWARTTSAGGVKFIILENADKMQESARNSLLKILEEPPEGVYFILLTSQKEAMLPTLLSRLRPLALADRTQDQQRVILEKIFVQKDSKIWNGLEDFCQSHETQKEGLFTSLAVEFLENLRHPVFPLEVPGKFWSEGANFRFFLEALVEQLERGLRGEGPSRSFTLSQRENFFRKISEALHRRETLNQGAPLLVETLFYQARSLE